MSASPKLLLYPLPTLLPSLVQVHFLRKCQPVLHRGCTVYISSRNKTPTHTTTRINTGNTKPVTKDHIASESIDMKCPEEVNPRGQNINECMAVRAEGRKEGHEMGLLLLLLLLSRFSHGRLCTTP